MKSIFIYALLLLSMSFYGQNNYSNIWYFGKFAGIDFDYGIPQSLVGGTLNTWEGCASISNESGELLFYTDGQKVYNRNHMVMPNGDGLLGDYSSSQSVLIVPKPNHEDNNSIYYIFTTDNWQDNLQNGFRYSIVDMKLDGGLGDVTNNKNILLEDKVAEKVAAVQHANENDIWVLTHDWGNNNFLAYLLTNNGLNTEAIESSIGYPNIGEYNIASGQLKFSKNGSFLASTTNYVHLLEIMKFDKSSGSLSNLISFQDPDLFNRVWGIEFSPNEQYLYFAKRPPQILYQLDLNEWDHSAIINSAFALKTTNGNPDDFDAGTLQIGPDGKIYLSRYEQAFVSVINHPNEKFGQCDFNDMGIELSGGLCQWGLPNSFYYDSFRFISGSDTVASICEGDSIFLERAWRKMPGSYHDTISIGDDWDNVICTSLSINERPHVPMIYQEDTILSSSSGPFFQWFLNGTTIAGAVTSVYTPMTTGNYRVAVSNENGCVSYSNEYYFENSDINNEFKIYPNPASKLLNIESDRSFTVEVTDLYGRHLYKLSGLTGHNQYNVEFLPSSVYIFKIDAEGRQYFERIVKY